MQDPHTSVRRAAAEALATLSDKGDKRVLEAVGRMLRDSDSSVRKAAVDTLSVLVEADERNL